jgi:putative transcriptional regulator
MTTKKKRSGVGARVLKALQQAERFSRGEHVPGIRVTTFPNIKAIRAKLKLDQKQFAERFGLSVDSIQNWEQGRRIPDVPAKILLAVIAKHPKAVEDALAEFRD